MEQSQAARRSILTSSACLLIRGYQILTTGGPRHCRFLPSCSHYAQEAMETKGFWRGLMSAARRILKCHPWNPGGYDPVVR